MLPGTVGPVPHPGLDRMRDVAIRATRRGGRIVRSVRPGTATAKGSGDYVSEVDRRSEAAVVDLLGAETPDVPILAEEGGGRTGDRYWVVDPLDGTANFLHGFPVVGVSVALVEHGLPVVGAVHAPFLDLLFVAARGEGG